MSAPPSAPDPLFPATPPGQDDLPYSDGEPMESVKHHQQQMLLVETLKRHLRDRPDVFVGANQAVYYSLLQTRKNDFKAPDFFVVLDAIPDRERKSWVVWEEDGRTPDVAIELLSETTEANDRGQKMRLYARALKVSAYYLYDPLDGRFEGYALDAEHLEYVPMVPAADGSLDCAPLGLRLAVVHGSYLGAHGTWLRWKSADGALLPTGDESAEAERTRAEAERTRSEAERTRAERLAAQLRAMGVDPDA